MSHFGCAALTAPLGSLLGAARPNSVYAFYIRGHTLPTHTHTNTYTHTHMQTLYGPQVSKHLKSTSSHGVALGEPEVVYRLILTHTHTHVYTHTHTHTHTHSVAHTQRYK